MKLKAIDSYLKNASLVFKHSGLKLRPNAGLGLWISMLLPTAIILSMLKLPSESTDIYKQNGIACVGILIVNLVQFYKIGKDKKLNISISATISSACTAFLFWICLKKSIPYSIISGLITTFGYALLLPFCLHTFPMAFTYGEASLCTQATILFLFSAIINILNIIYVCEPPYTNSTIATTILQVGILGVFLLLTILYSIKKLRTTLGFYVATFLVIAIGVIPTLHFLLERSPVLWLLIFIFESLSRLYVILFWIVCVMIAILSLYFQISGGNHASTSVRKIFHILAVIVFIPGLLFECTLLYTATGIIFALFVAFETIRNLNIPPIAALLQEGFQTYVDEKDAGEVALTPIYLLTGCSLPLWLHPCPCDLTDSAGFQLLVLLSGILSIGIGDTMASIVGSKFGKHKWKGSNKSIEGTIASVIFQILCIVFLMHLGFVLFNWATFIKCTFAITINALVEAKTDQVDNLILPVITYILLI